MRDAPPGVDQTSGDGVAAVLPVTVAQNSVGRLRRARADGAVHLYRDDVGIGQRRVGPVAFDQLSSLAKRETVVRALVNQEYGLPAADVEPRERLIIGNESAGQGGFFEVDRIERPLRA